MVGILPDASAGGLIIRNANGVCQTHATVFNAFCPPSDFKSTCALTALPNDCSARITAPQLNAIVSEMLSFAACLNPDGTWTCDSVSNLCAAFTAWAAENKVVDGVSIVGDGTLADPFRVAADGLSSAICSDDSAADALAACLIDEAANNTLTVGPNGRLFVGADAVAAAICADDSAGDTLANCLVSTDAGNSLTQGTDGRLFTAGGLPDPDTIPLAGCGEPATLIGYDAGGNPLRFDWEGAMEGSIVPPTQDAQTVTAFGLETIGTFGFGQVQASIVNPSACKEMSVYASDRVYVTYRKFGSGAISLVATVGVNGGAQTTEGFHNQSDIGRPGTQGDQTSMPMFERRRRIAILPPGGAITREMDLTLTATTPYAAGSVVDVVWVTILEGIIA